MTATEATSFIKGVYTFTHFCFIIKLNGRSLIILPYKEDGLNQVSDIHHQMYLKMINYKSIS